MKYETKKKLKKWLGIGGVILASVLLCALVGNLSGGFQNMNPKDWDISMRNENNIIPVDELKEKVKSEAGFTVTQKDGVLKLSGKNKTETEASVDLATFTVPAGEYMFMTGRSGINNDTGSLSYNMTLVDSGTRALIATADKTEPFVAETDIEVILVLTVAADEKVEDVVLYPAVVEGDDEVGYYGNSKSEE